MSKKTRPVLYEVLRRRSENRAQWRPTRARGAEADSPAESPDPTPTHRPMRESPPHNEILRVLGSRVEFSLNVATLAGLGAGLVVLFIVVFQLGRFSGGPSGPARIPPSDGNMANLLNTISDRGAGPSESPGGLREPERPPMSVPGGPSSSDGDSRDDSARAAQPADSEKTEPPPSGGTELEKKPSLQLVKGRSYILIQCFRERDRQAAEDAATFLIQNGVPCGIQDRRDDIVLWATEAFDIGSDNASTRRSEQQRAKKLETRIKELGDTYFKQNGKYRFKDAYIRSAG